MRRLTIRGTWILLAAVSGSTASAAPQALESLQLRELEEQNAQLEERLAALEESQLAERSGLLIDLEGARAAFQIFGDVGLRYDDPAPMGQGHSAFGLGSFALVANVQFADSYRVFSETVIDADSDGSVHADQERLWASWTQGDLLTVKVGVEHSPISRWNQLYHHERWLETTIDRPSLVAFEGGGGILPLHRTGIELSGAWHLESGRFEYFGTLSNGRGIDPTDKQRTSDANDGKAVDIGIAYSPASRPDLRIGVAGTYDDIPADPLSGDPARAGSIRELIAMGQLQVDVGPLEVLAEYGFITHDARATGQDFGSTAGYVQVGYPCGTWTPYTRFDHRNMDEGDPFYAPLDRDLDLWKQVLGVRWDATSHLAVKVELGYGEEDERSGVSISGESVYSAAFQVSWWL